MAKKSKSNSDELFSPDPPKPIKIGEKSKKVKEKVEEPPPLPAQTDQPKSRTAGLAALWLITADSAVVIATLGGELLDAVAERISQRADFKEIERKFAKLEAEWASDKLEKTHA